MAPLALAVVAVALTTAAQPTGPRRVLMISLDGLSPREYSAASKADIPAIRALAQRGAWSSGVRGIVPTVTYPSHTTLITGVAPAHHGIYDNRIFDPENRSDGAWHWYADGIRVVTLPAAVVRARRGAAGAASWPVSVGMDIDYNVPEFWRARHPEQLSLIKALSRPRNILSMIESGRGAPMSGPLTDRDRTDVAKYMLRAIPRGIVLLHLLEYDSAEHNQGPGSAASLATLERLDGYIGELVQTVEEQGARGDTVIAIVSDHGFRTYTQTLSPNALFKREGLLTTNDAGTITSWDAVYHSSGGSGFIYLKRPDDSALAARVDALLQQLKADQRHGIETIWRRADLTRLQAHPGGSFGIAMANGFYSSDDTSELLRTGKPRGGHGYSPEITEMNAALIVAGDSVPRRGDIGIVRMTQIAPTLARMLGVELNPQADKPLW